MSLTHFSQLNTVNIKYTQKLYHLLGEKSGNLKLMAAMHLKKAAPGPWFLLWSVPSSPETSRTWGEQLLELLEGMLSRSCLMEDFNCSPVLGLMRWIWSFMVCLSSTGETSGVQTEFSTWSHAGVMDAVSGLALSCWNMQDVVQMAQMCFWSTDSAFCRCVSCPHHGH